MSHSLSQTAGDAHLRLQVFLSTPVLCTPNLSSFLDVEVEAEAILANKKLLFKPAMEADASAPPASSLCILLILLLCSTRRKRKGAEMRAKKFRNNELYQVAGSRQVGTWYQAGPRPAHFATYCPLALLARFSIFLFFMRNVDATSRMILIKRQCCTCLLAPSCR